MDNTISVDEAYQCMLDSPELVRKYEQKCYAHNWPEKQLRKGPQWAAWFARAVLTDHWPPAEGLIAADHDTDESYNQYVELMRSIGMIDHTLGRHQMKRDREDAQKRMLSAQRALRYGPEVARLRRSAR